MARHKVASKRRHITILKLGRCHVTSQFLKPSLLTAFKNVKITKTWRVLIETWIMVKAASNVMQILFLGGFGFEARQEHRRQLHAHHTGAATVVGKAGWRGSFPQWQVEGSPGWPVSTLVMGAVCSFLYYNRRNFCNLIGLEQWYSSLIWNTYMWKVQTFCR